VHTVKETLGIDASLGVQKAQELVWCMSVPEKWLSAFRKSLS
jgi:hypothetical protein